MGVAFLSVLAKEAMYRVTLKAGEEANSKVVIANAHHHRSDAYSSLVALVGIGGGVYFGIPWLDPVAGLVVAGMVVSTGIEVTREAVGDLLDTNVSAEFITEIAHVVSSVPGVTLNHRTKVRLARVKRVTESVGARHVLLLTPLRRLLGPPCSSSSSSRSPCVQDRWDPTF